MNATLMRYLLLLCLWHGSVAAQDNLAVAGSVLNITWEGRFTSAEQQRLRAWLADAAAATATLYGELPRDNIRIVLRSQRFTTEPVPFAQVIRSHPEGVQFWVNPGASLAELKADWTAVHELAHLYIPWPGQRDVWLSEGLATWYQNVLRVRSSHLTEQQAWRKIDAGLRRGLANDAHGDLTLEQLSARLHERRAYMRVYWSGVAFFMEAEPALHAASDGQLTMDDVLQAYTRCCLNQGRTSGRAMVRRWDELADVSLFEPLYERYRALRSLPPREPLFAPWGVRVDNNEVMYSVDSTAAALRRTLFASHSGHAGDPETDGGDNAER